MSVTEVEAEEWIKVYSPDSIVGISTWLGSKGWEAGTDYVYLGMTAKVEEVFMFADKDNATIFKLTWGGK